MHTMLRFADLVLDVVGIDFLDPDPSVHDGRERGVRVELRSVEPAAPTGSAYASDPVRLAPALVRIDLLESAPGAGDRMHWHPGMTDGEPGDRVLDPGLRADPLVWLAAMLGPALLPGTDAHTAGLVALAAAREEVLAVVARELERVRAAPLVEVARDQQGLAEVG